MKRVQHYGTARDKLLHIETEGAVVNIRVDLQDREGREVTSIEVVPDDESRGGDGEGRVWDLAGPHNTRLIRRASRQDGPYVDDAHRGVLAAAQEAANASRGDSNDKEIEALQDALDAALSALGLRMPEPTEDEEN